MEKKPSEWKITPVSPERRVAIVRGLMRLLTVNGIQDDNRYAGYAYWLNSWAPWLPSQRDEMFTPEEILDTLAWLLQHIGELDYGQA
jgi:hypothetical protein